MKKNVFLYLFLFINYTLLSQNYNFKKIQESNLSITQKIDKLDSLFFTLKGKSTDSLYRYKNQYSSWLYRNGILEKSIEIRNETLATAYLLKNSDSIQKNFFWLGHCYKKKSHYLKAIHYFNRSLKYNNNNETAAKSYFQLGVLYHRISDFQNSITYYKLATLLLKKNKKLPQLRNVYTNMAKVYNVYFTNKKYLLNGINYGKKADSISKIIPTSNDKKYLIKIILATLYNENETLNINTALKYYKEALQIGKSQNDSKKINEVHLLMGNLFNTTNAKKSFEYLNKVKQNTKKKDSILLSQLYFNYALTHNLAKEYPKSIVYFKKAIFHQIGFNFTDNTYTNNTILIRTNHKRKLLHFLPYFAKTYLNYYNATKKSEFLQKSLFYYKLADNLIDIIKTNSNEFKSRLFWREKSSKIYSNAIKTCLLNNNIEDAFYFMEKNKALLLLEDIANQNYKISLETPKQLLAKEMSLKKELMLLKNKQTTNKDSLFKATIDLTRKLNSFQDSIYHGNKKHFDTHFLSISDIQKNMLDKNICIEFHLSDTEGYVIVISKTKKFFYRLENFSKIKSALKNLLISLKKPHNNNNDVHNFKILSYDMYNLLFPASEIKKLINSNNLVIVPDKNLSLLPFETLISKKDSFNYLINNSNISYAYSMSFLHNCKQFKRAPKKEFIGFAPIYFDYDSLTTLKKSKQEIMAVKTFFSGDTFFEEKASKQNFKNTIFDYNIIHLATHADASDTKSPWIAFKNEKLTLSELYTIKTQANLVVLSACNTSIGKMADGEGVLSLSRGFFYSGSNSVVSSLWNANDKSSTDIMIDFYTNLKKGKTKATALRLAKIKYLKNHSLTDASPYFWSSFILIGDANKLNSNNTHLLPILYISCVFLLLFVLYKRYKH